MDKLKIYLTACSLAALPAMIPATGMAAGKSDVKIEAPTGVEDNVTVTGKVTEQDGSPMAGVTVVVKGTTVGTITDTEGKFTLDAPEDAVLVFSFLDHKTVEYTVDGKNDMGVIVLEKGSDDSSKLVHTAFKDEKASEILGGVSYVNIEDIIDKNYFTYTMDNLYTFVSGYNGSGMWGITDDILTVVDGIPNRGLNNLKPDEIEQISFLKGAQAVAIYGSQGAKGAIVVTTKRGKQQDMKISARANTGIYVDKSYPEYLGAAEYMTYYNQARANDGLTPLYTDEEIYYTASGKNPYRYPDVDFFSSEYIKKVSNRTDVTAEINGGSKFARYYSNVSYYTTNDNLKIGEGEKLGTDRFSIRGNVDMDFNDYISASVDANVTLYNSKGYVSNNGSYWSAANSWRPNRIAPFIPTSYISEYATEAKNLISLSDNIQDGKFLAGSSTDQTNIFADLYYAGKTKNTIRQFQFDMKLDFDLSQLVSGLSFHTIAGMDYNTSYNTSYTNKYAVFVPTWSNVNGVDEIVELTKINEDQKSGVQNVSGNYNNRTTSLAAHFDYDKVFGNHTLRAMLLANGWQTTETGQYHSQSNANLGLDIHYDFSKRYYAAFTAAVPYSAKLEEGSRAGFSPSLSLGWNITNESFFSKGFLSSLMLSVSASDLKQDIDINSYYMYLGKYSIDASYVTWGASGNQVGFQSKSAANPDFGYIHRKELSANLRAGFMEDKLTADFSAFTSVMSGLIYQPASKYPSYFSYNGSSFIPNVNYNEDLRQGFDLSLNYKGNIGDVKFGLGVNLTYINVKAKKRDDSTVEFDYQKTEGTKLNANWGYECLGFFTDADFDANGALKEGIPVQSGFGSTIRPGDLRYKDQNGDGIIDSKDVVDLGTLNSWSYGAPYTMGINFTASYKGFTLYVLGIGQTGFTSYYNGSYYWPAGEDKYSANVREAWTPETANSAKYPRLTTGSDGNNRQTSDFWAVKMSLFDLTRVQLTYDLPSRLFEGNRVLSGASVYVSGSDLAYISKNRDKLELSTGAPQTRFYNLGVKVNF